MFCQAEKQKNPFSITSHSGTIIRKSCLEHFEKLDVYPASIEVVVLINKITESFPRGRAYLTDQLQRAGTSIALNIAERSGEFYVNEKSSFYRMAKRSATERAAIFDVAKRIIFIFKFTPMRKGGDPG